jgi:hypothetical protein
MGGFGVSLRAFKDDDHPKRNLPSNRLRQFLLESQHGTNQRRWN